MSMATSPGISPQMQPRALTPVRATLLFVLALALMEVVVYREFLFGDKVLIFKDLADDSYTGVYPNYVLTTRLLKSGQIPSFSFETALGDDIYSLWLEPVSLVVMLGFFSDDVAGGMVWVQLIYTLLGGLAFWGFLRNLGIRWEAAMPGAMFFAFSGYMVLEGTWLVSQFPAQTADFAFLLFALERGLARKGWLAYTLAVALIALQRPFDLYFAALLTLCFALIQHLWRAEAMNLRALRKLTAPLGAGVLGIAMGSITLLSTLHQMLNSPRGDGGEALTSQLASQPVWALAPPEALKTTLLRFLGYNAEGNIFNFSGWYNYVESPVLYSGLLALLLLPQLWAQFAGRQRRIILSVFGIYVLLFVFPYFRYLCWLFTGDYYRVLSLFTTIFIITIAAKILHHILDTKKVNLGLLLVGGGLFSGLVWALAGADSSVFARTASVMCIYIVLLFGFSRKKIQIIPFLFITIFVEIAAVANEALYERDTYTTQTIATAPGYEDIAGKVARELQATAGRFIRIEKDFYSGSSRVYSYNDAKVQQYYSSQSYSSFHNKYYIKFLKNVGGIRLAGEAGTRWLSGVSTIPQAARLCGVNFLISNDKNAEEKYQNWGESIVKSYPGIKIVKVKDALPLGATFRRYIALSDFQTLPVAMRQQCLLQAVAIDDADLPEAAGLERWVPVPTEDSTTYWKSLLCSDTLNIVEFSDNCIKGNIALSEPKFLFFSIPYAAGWHLRLNGKPHALQTAFGGLSGAILSPGEYAVELHYRSPLRNVGTAISLLATLIFLLWAGFAARKRFVTHGQTH